MKLIDFISVTSADETIHIVTQDNSVYYGTARGAYDEFSSDRMKTAQVTMIFTGFGGLCVEIAE